MVAAPRIPSTQLLRALEAVARLGSVWQAADELNLTRSAVSHQLRFLERELGFPLTRRAGKGLALTPRAQRYAVEVRRAFALLGEAATAVEGEGVGGPLAVSCSPGFASLWLCPRVGSFRAAHPEVALRVVTPPRPGAVEEGAADLFVAFGRGDWPGHAATLLREVAFTPLCAPALLNQLGGLAQPADVLRGTLLHLGDPGDWRRWLARAGVAHAGSEGVVFSDMNLVFAAAIAGQGLALGDGLTCGQALESGRLVRPFDLAVPAGGAYHLVLPLDRPPSPAAAAFAAWLRAGLAETPAAPEAALQ